MPTKAELSKDIENLKKRLILESKSNELLLKQQKEFRKMAEKAGSELAVWKHKCLRLEEQIMRLENELKNSEARSKLRHH